MASTSLAAALLGVGLVVLILRVQSELDAIHEDSRSVREGLVLALLVREHLQHEAHTVATGGGMEMAVHHSWLSTLLDRSESLATRIPTDLRPRVTQLQDLSRELDRGFREVLTPAVRANDQAALSQAYREAQSLTRSATAEADALVHALQARMDAAQQRARRASRVAVVVGSTGSVVIMTMALMFALVLRRKLTAPLAELASAAEGFGTSGEVRPLTSLGYRELAQVATAFNDMTEAIRERERRAIDAERWATIGQLTAGIAHELNNPIGVISGYLHTILPSLDEGELKQELLIVDEEAKACGRIVGDLLQYAGAPNVALEEVSATTTLEAAVRSADDAFGRESAVQVVTSVEDATLCIDPVRIRQVVVNLVQNAIQASGAAGEVHVRGSLGDDASYRIEVSDRGSGFSEADAAQLFEPFYSKRPGGTGLGLAITKAIVDAHGGHIAAFQREGGGTRMVVTLPTHANMEEP